MLEYKVAQFFPKEPLQLLFKKWHFCNKDSPKRCQIFGLLLQKNRHQDLYKIAQSDHTALVVTAFVCSTCLLSPTNLGNANVSSFFFPSASFTTENSQCRGKYYSKQRTLTYFIRGSLNVRLTSCLTDLDSAEKVHLFLIKHKESCWFQISQIRGPYLKNASRCLGS